MTTKTIEILKASTIDGNNVKLPDIVLDRKEYVDVKKTLDGIGGKWKGGKTQAFVFIQDPRELFNEILGGKKVNLKKDFQFFGTPEILADRLVELAEIKKTHTFLEPSAGQGAIIKAIRKIVPEKPIGYYELMKQNRDIVKDIDANILYLGEDFLKHDSNIKFDRIIANPPFTKNQDIDHLLKMYECLNVNGVLVCMTSTSWEKGNQKKQLAFKEFLNNVGAEIINVEAGAFKESGTNVETRIIVIDKSKQLIQKDKNANIKQDEDIESFDELFKQLEELDPEFSKSLMGV
jgi:hypothetical protein